MKILKRILIALGVLVLLVLIVAAFVGNDFSVQREVTVNKPKAEVFNYVKMVGNQKILAYGKRKIQMQKWKQAELTVPLALYQNGIAKSGKLEKENNKLLL